MPTSEPKDQRHIDREAELARQKEVNDAVRANELNARAQAEKILAGETSVEELEAQRVAEFRKVLNKSVEGAKK